MENPTSPLDLRAFETEQRLALRSVATRFTEREIVPHLAAWECDGEVPRALHRKAAAAGLLGIGFDEEVGGSGGDVVDLVVATEAMIEAGASSGLMAALYTHGIALPHIVAAGHAEQIERWVRPTLAGDLIGSLAVTESGGGSDVANLTTRAVRDDDCYVVDGAKAYITSGTRADFVTTAVRTGGAGHGGVSLLVIEAGTPGFTVGRKLEKMGWRCSDTAELAFVDCRVPATNLVGAEGGGFALAMQQFVGERLSLAVQAYAVAQRALDLTAAWCKQRSTFGRPLASRQVVQHKLVRMHEQIALARTFTRTVALRMAAGEQPVGEALTAKNTAVAAVEAVVDEAVQLHGGMGYMQESEVERHYRDARVLGIGGGATEVLTDLSARLHGFTP